MSVQIQMLVMVMVLMAGAVRADEPAKVTTGAEKLGWKLAVHSYTFSKFSILSAVDKTGALGIKYMSISGSVNWPAEDGPGFKTNGTLGMTDAQLDAIKKRMKEKGVEPVFLNCGVLAPTGDEAKTRKMFENLKRLGIDVMVCEPVAKDMDELPKVMDVIEKLAVEFKIKVAIHEHPKPNFYWNPDTVLAAVKGRSELLGACADVGHWKRSGLDPVECLRKLEGRVIAVHFKDLATDPETALHDVPWGTGQSNARGMLEELKRQKFKGAICVEYEYHWENSSPEIAESKKWFEKTCEELAK